MANNTQQEIAVRQVLNHYNSHLADIMEKYAISAPRISPGAKASFEAAITHQMDIEQSSLLQIIEAECTRREQALLNELEASLKVPNTRAQNVYVKEWVGEFITTKRQSLKERKES